MTHEEKIQELIIDIREKLPRLKEGRKGCKVARLEDYGEIISIAGDKTLILFENGETQQFYETELLHKFEIIGAEPMLNDVLNWLSEVKIIDETYYIENYGEVYSVCHDWYDTNNIEYKYCAEWDLSKPYLKDQSEELIDFLYELIKD